MKKAVRIRDSTNFSEIKSNTRFITLVKNNILAE